MLKLLISFWIGTTLLLVQLQSSSANIASKQPASPIQALSPFKAYYSSKVKGFKVTGTQQLSLNAAGQYEYTSQADSWFAHLTESSKFHWLQDDILVPSEYVYQRSILARKRHATLQFDWDRMRVTNNVQNTPWGMQISDGTMDKLSHIIQMRHDLSQGKEEFIYTIADGGKLKRYHYIKVAEEVLNTPLGQLNTIKIKRIRKNKKRQTTLWLAKDWNFLLVQLVQIEKDGTYEMKLKSAIIEGRSVKPLSANNT